MNELWTRDMWKPDGREREREREAETSEEQIEE